MEFMEATMNGYSILPDGKLAVTASESSSKHDFDFLVGGWKIKNRKLKEPLSGRDEWDEFDATQNLRLILQGFGNFDIFSTELPVNPSKASRCGCSIRIPACGPSIGQTVAR
jgi:hypothetical protein